MRRSLPEGAVLFDYLSDADRLGVLAASSRRIGGRSGFASESRVRSLTQSLLFSLRSAAFEPGGSSDPARLAGALEPLAAAVLWPALESWGEIPRLLAIAPTGPLGRIPWAALPLPDGRALCEAARVVVIPGIRLGLSQRRVVAAAGAPLIVAPGSADLEHVAAESRAIRARFPAAEILEGAAATRAAFRSKAARAPWIHFAGHGLYRAEAPEWSGLELSDGWLSSEELSQVRLAADRVVLAACQTARALVRPGEEWFGLVRTLLLGGARTVVASQWDVEDAAALRFMSELYARLAEGFGVAEALSRTQAAEARAGRHPLDWAGFVCLGGPEALDFLPSSDGGSPSYHSSHAGDSR